VKIIRVFPHRTSFTPVDDYSFVGLPTLFIPEHDEVHISVAFTWHKDWAEILQRNWKDFTDKPVLIGGPAYDDPGNGFQSGMYLKKGITITSRGCPNNCWFCMASQREGDIRELPIVDGNIIQDNNLLACSRNHINNVFDMLKTKHSICFKGGIDAYLLKDWHIQRMQELKVKEIWLACDSRAHLEAVIEAIHKLRKAGLNQNKIRCFVLVGFDRAEETDRLIQLYHSGCLPFAQLYQPEKRIEYDWSWRDFQRTWCRPAAYKTLMKEK
jgi:hypothetical protein